jgi:hypothetical protein
LRLQTEGPEWRDDSHLEADKGRLLSQAGL